MANDAPKPLLSDVKVIELSGEPLAMGGRMLADLGAEVVKIEPEGGDPMRRQPPLHHQTGESLRFQAWHAGKISIEYSAERHREILDLLKGADVVLETPGWVGTTEMSAGVVAFDGEPAELAPGAVWLKATPFGLAGPHAQWTATDLGILAGSGNLYATGFPERAPVRCAEPAAYTHAASEAAFAVLAALRAGIPQVIDLSMAEAMAVTNMGGAGQFPKTQRVGYRMGPNIGRTREAWPCKNGGFISFGLRGGRARLKNFYILMEEFKKAGLETAAWFERDWEKYDVNEVSDEEITAIEEPLKQLFMTKTMSEWYALAAETNLMIASANTPKEIYENAQLQSRDFFTKLGHLPGFPKCWVHTRSTDNSVAATQATQTAPEANSATIPNWPAKTVTAAAPKPICAGLKIVEFGAGAAGPIAARYFAEHGATVIKVESKNRPEFLRMMAYNTPHQLEGSTLFDALNPGKHSITINLKSPDGIAIAKKLIHWADAVQENFAPKAMKGFGLDYESMVKEKPDLVMVSTCLNGQTGPYKDYPGFGSQGAALSGYNSLTGYPDLDPISPFGTVTDSLGPRFSATALMAGLLHKQRTGKGIYFDISQVEIAAYSLSPWLLDYSVNGQYISRMGNRSLLTAPHGVFPTQGSDEPMGDRWIAIATWSDEQWAALAELIGLGGNYPTVETRLEHQREIEAAISAWTEDKQAVALAEQLQALGIEAVPVYSFADQFNGEPQFQTREHFIKLNRPVTGEFYYERNGFRCSASPSGYDQPTPLLGEQTDHVLSEFLGYSTEEIIAMRESGGVE